MTRLRTLSSRLRTLSSRLVLVVLLAAAGAGTAEAQRGPATGTPLLRLDPHARTAALGGAFTAVAADYAVLRYNPAAVGLLLRPSFAASYHTWIQDSHQNHVEVGFPLRRGGFGVSFSHLDAGSIEERDADFHTTGAVLRNTDLMLVAGGAYALFLGDVDLSLGSNVRYVFRHLAGTSGEAFGLDAGALLAYGPVALGAAIQNLSITPARFYRTVEYLPRTYRLGVAYRHRFGTGTAARVALDAVKPHADGAWQPLVGGEVILDQLTFRSGYRITDGGLARWQAGLGLRTPIHAMGEVAQLHLDYSFAPQPAWAGSGTHHLTLSFRPGTALSKRPERPTRPRVEPSLVLPEPLRLERVAPPPRAQLWLKRRPAWASRFSAAAFGPATPMLLADLDRLPAQPRFVPDLMRMEPAALHEPPPTMGLTMHVAFRAGQTRLLTPERHRLDTIAEHLKAAPERAIWVAAYTDPSGSLAHNLMLSEHRLDAVIGYLEREHGIAADRFVKPTAYGETQHAPGLRPAAQRRVEITLLAADLDTEAFLPEASLVEGVYTLSASTVAIFRNGSSPYRLVPDEPHRITAIFPGLFSAAAANTTVPKNSRLIRAIRTRFDDETRSTVVTVEFARPAAYSVEDKGRILLLHLSEPARR